MGFFKNKQTVYRETAWQELSEEDLRSRIAPVLAYLASSLEATQGLIVSPGSNESKRFIHEVSEALNKFADTPPPPARIESSRTAFEESAKEFGTWQAEQVVGLQKDIANAVEAMAPWSRWDTTATGNATLAAGQASPRSPQALVTQWQLSPMAL